MRNLCIITLGSNQSFKKNSPLVTLKMSLTHCVSESLNIYKISKWYSTPAFPLGSGPDFVNGAALLETTLSPQDVINILHNTESHFGRVRRNRWEERTIDLDLIAYNDLVLPSIKTYEHWKNIDLEEQKSIAPNELILPHPRVQDRAFALLPIKDVAPNWKHPITGLTVDQMLEQIPKDDLDDIKIIEN